MDSLFVSAWLFGTLLVLMWLLYECVGAKFLRHPVLFLLVGTVLIVAAGAHGEFTSIQITKTQTFIKSLKPEDSRIPDLQAFLRGFERDGRLFQLLFVALASGFLALAYQFRAQNAHDSCRKREERSVQTAKMQLRELKSERSELKKTQLFLVAGIQEDEKLQDLIGKRFKETELKKIHLLMQANDEAEDKLLEGNNFSADDFQDSSWLK